MYDAWLQSRKGTGWAAWGGGAREIRDETRGRPRHESNWISVSAASFQRMRCSGMGREKRQGEENSEALPAMELPSTPPRPGSVTRIFSPRNLKTWCSGYVHEAPAGTTLAWTPLFSAGWEKGRGSPGELETNASVMTWASSLAAAAQSRCNPLS